MAYIGITPPQSKKKMQGSIFCLNDVSLQNRRPPINRIIMGGTGRSARQPQVRRASPRTRPERSPRGRRHKPLGNLCKSQHLDFISLFTEKKNQTDGKFMIEPQAPMKKTIVLISQVNNPQHI
jgi:hypothetical protein